MTTSPRLQVVQADDRAPIVEIVATPLCCLEFVSLVREAGLAESWCQTFINPDNALAERLATDRRVAFLSFIGSARVGWHLHGKLAPGTRSVAP